MPWWRRGGADEGPAGLVGQTKGDSPPAYGPLVAQLIDAALGRRSATDEEAVRLGREGPSTWRRLDEAARSGLLAGAYPPDEALRQRLGPGCPTLLAVVASFHRNGRIREAAVDVLDARDGPAAGKALALRTADWVDVVREKARRSILRRTGCGDAGSIVPFLAAMLDRERAQGLLEEYLARLDAEAVRDLARSGTRPTRRSLVEHPGLPDADLLCAAVEDDDPVVRSRAARALLTRRPGAAAELFLRGSGSVRALAVAEAPSGLVVEQAESLLLDRRVSVRHAGQRRLGALGHPVADRYRQLVAAQVPAPVAIRGLGETGGRADEPAIVGLVHHADEAVRRAALAAARLLVSEEKLVELASTALHDESDLVVRAAARILRRRASLVPREVVDEAVASTSRATRLAGLRLVRRRDAWSRLEADLRLALDADESVSREGKEDLPNWTTRVAPGLYGRPPADQLDSIRRLLDQAGLQASLDREIRFHCGLAG